MALGKQVVPRKKTYPQATVYTSSDSYSMGNSVNVHLTDEKGNPMPKEIIEDVKRFGEQFVYGSFNGMISILVTTMPIKALEDNQTTNAYNNANTASQA